MSRYVVRYRGTKIWIYGPALTLLNCTSVISILEHAHAMFTCVSKRRSRNADAEQQGVVVVVGLGNEGDMHGQKFRLGQQIPTSPHAHLHAANSDV